MVLSVKETSVVMDLSDAFIHPRVPERLRSFNDVTDITVDPARQSGSILWRETRFDMSLPGSDQPAADLKFFPGVRARDLT